jgi:hypothetical protein
LAAGAPDVVAEIVVTVVPVGVLDVVLNDRLTVAGKLEIEAEGVKLQVTPVGIPLAGHASVTVPPKDPSADTTNAIADELDPRDTLTLAGLGAPSAKSTTCSVTGASCVVIAASLPTA